MKENKWETFEMLNKISSILIAMKNSRTDNLFFTPYQIALLFEKNFFQVFQKFNKPIGGQGTNQHSSFAQYIARQLSSESKKNNSIIEMGYLSNHKLDDLKYKYKNTIVSSSVVSRPISIFRISNHACCAGLQPAKQAKSSKPINKTA